MKPVHGYLGWIERLSLWQLMMCLISGYLLLAFLFSLLYGIDGWVENTTDSWDAFYFSVVTQSTLGYGDKLPHGPAKVIVIVHVILAVTLFSISTGVIVTKMITVGRGVIVFDKWLTFDRQRREFRFRFVNRLPIPLVSIHTEMRIRFNHPNPGEYDALVVKKYVPIQSADLTELLPMQPMRIRTVPLPIEDHDKVLEPFAFPALAPDQLSTDMEVIVFMEARHAFGTVSARKVFISSDIRCGSFENVTSKSGAKKDWNNWDKIKLTLLDQCSSCHFGKGCFLKAHCRAC